MRFFYAKMLKNDAELAVDVLTDILQNPTFPMEEIVKERDVVLKISVLHGEKTLYILSFNDIIYII